MLAKCDSRPAIAVDGVADIVPDGDGFLVLAFQRDKERSVELDVGVSNLQGATHANKWCDHWMINVESHGAVGFTLARRVQL
ncbi:hypothetical protein D3C85_1815800 [compost metagenome]